MNLRNDCRKPKPKLLLRPITTGANSAMNQSEFLAITCNLLKAREKSRVQDAIGFGFASNWLKNWRETFKPITKRSNRNNVITFDSHLKTALLTNVQSCMRWRGFIHNLSSFAQRRSQTENSRHFTATFRMTQDTNLLTWNCNWCSLLHNTSLHTHTNYDRASRVEDMLRKDTKFARKHCNMFEFITFFLLEFLQKEKDHSFVRKKKKKTSQDASLLHRSENKCSTNLVN